jgi:hypothetical protein
MGTPHQVRGKLLAHEGEGADFCENNRETILSPTQRLKGGVPNDLESSTGQTGVRLGGSVPRSG